MSLLNPKLNQYFGYHVLLHVRITPSPSSAAEVQHLYTNFKNLGTLEYFRIPRNNSVGRFSSSCFALYNPSLNASLITPFSVPEASIQNSATNSKIAFANQTALKNKLNSLIAIPRYSYIENDAEYHSNKSSITFKYSMSKAGLGLDKKFDISKSTFATPFCYASLPTDSGTPSGSPPEDAPSLATSELDEFRKQIRHNFQKFHKFSNFSITEGIEAVNCLGAAIEADNVTYTSIDPQQILNI